MTMPRKASGAFTLLELMVVVGLIAALSFVLLGALNPGRGAAVQAGQAILANFLVAARSKAAAGNQPVRLLVNFTPDGADQPSRFLRLVVLQIQSGSAWRSVSEAYLPEGVYVVPGNGSMPAGLLGETESAWTRTDGSALRSTALRSVNSITEAIGGGPVELWLCLPIAAAGTTNSSGDLIVAAGRPRAPGSFAAGDSPIELPNPEEVRGLAVSQYGVATLIDGRLGF